MLEVKLRVIEEVRKRPVLWDYQNIPTGRNHNEVAAAWTEVGKVLDIDAAECKLIWTRLRTHFRAEALSIPKRIARAKKRKVFDPNKKYYSWKLFDALKFVADGRSATAKFDLSFQNNSDKGIAENNAIDQTESEFCDSSSYQTENYDDMETAECDKPDQVKSEKQQDHFANNYESGNEPEIIKSNTFEQTQCGQQSYFGINILPAKCDIPISPAELSNCSKNVPSALPEKHNSNSLDLNDEDYRFLYSFLSHTKVMTQLQNKEFRANMKNLLVDIFPASASISILEKRLLLPEDSDPERKFLTSFWPFLSSMSSTQNLQFRAKMSNLVLQILSSETIL